MPVPVLVPGGGGLTSPSADAGGRAGEPRNGGEDGADGASGSDEVAQAVLDEDALVGEAGVGEKRAERQQPNGHGYFLASISSSSFLAAGFSSKSAPPVTTGCRSLTASSLLPVR